MWQWEEQAQLQEDNRSHYSHKGRNNNNNNTQEKVLSPWDNGNQAMCDNTRACRWDGAETVKKGIKMSLQTFRTAETLKKNNILCFPPQISSAVRLCSCLHIWPHSSALCSAWPWLWWASPTPKPRIHSDPPSTSILRTFSVEPKPGPDLSSGAWFGVAVWRTAAQFVRREPINHRWVQHEEYKPCQRIFHTDHISVRTYYTGGEYHQSRTRLLNVYISVNCIDEDHRK